MDLVNFLLEQDAPSPILTTSSGANENIVFPEIAESAHILLTFSLDLHVLNNGWLMRLLWQGVMLLLCTIGGSRDEHPVRLG